MPNYLFDVKLFATFRINAESEAEARRLLTAALDCATVQAGFIDEELLTGEASVDGELILVEVDGEPYDG